MKELIGLFVSIAIDAWNAYQGKLSDEEVANQAADRIRHGILRQLAKDRFDRERKVVK